MQESRRIIYTKTEIDLRKNLFFFSKIHDNVLVECSRFLDKSLPEISRKFFEYLGEKNEFYGITETKLDIDLLSKPFNEYVRSLFSGCYDEYYANARALVVIGSIRNGVTFKIYQSFAFLIRNILVDVISRMAGGNPSIFAISGALDRLMMLEISIASDFYEHFALKNATYDLQREIKPEPCSSPKPNQFAMAYFKLAAKNKELQEAVKRESGKNPFAMAYFKVAAKHIPKTPTKTVIKDNRNMNPMVLAYYKVVNRARELQEMNRRDALTGLFNKSVFKSFLQRNISFSKRISFPLSVAFFDLDDFKMINDTLGHQKGDEILMTVGGVLTGTMRDVDRAFRFGGDEFCVVFPGTSAKNARIFFDRFMDGFSAIFPDVCMSVGIAQTGPHFFHDVDDLIRRADALMYEAKKVKGFYIEHDSEGLNPETAGSEVHEILPEDYVPDDE